MCSRPHQTASCSLVSFTKSFFASESPKKLARINCTSQAQDGNFSMPSSLSMLPVECHRNHRWCTRSNKPTLCPRLTRKELPRKTLYNFGYMNSSPSYKRTYRTIVYRSFQSISQIERLKYHVQTLLIRRQHDRWGRMGCGFHWPRPAGEEFPSHVVTRLSPQASKRHTRSSRSRRIVNLPRSIASAGGEGLYGSDRISSNDATAVILSIVSEAVWPAKSLFRSRFQNNPGSVQAPGQAMADASVPANQRFIAAMGRTLEELRPRAPSRVPTLFDWGLVPSSFAAHHTRLKKSSRLRFGFPTAPPAFPSLTAVSLVARPSSAGLQGIQARTCIRQPSICSSRTRSSICRSRASVSLVFLARSTSNSRTWGDQILDGFETVPTSRGRRGRVGPPRDCRNKRVYFLFHFPALDDESGVFVPGSEGRKFELSRLERTLIGKSMFVKVW